MVTTFATPLIKVVTNPSTKKGISSFVTSLFKNKGVQAGTGIAAIGASIGFTGNQVQEQTKGLPTGTSGIILIGIVLLVVFLVMKR